MGYAKNYKQSTHKINRQYTQRTQQAGTRRIQTESAK
jgi:hypothetical protein